MKKILYVFVLGALIFSCKKDQKSEGGIQEPQSVKKGFGFLPNPAYKSFPKVKDDFSNGRMQNFPSSYLLNCPPVGDQGNEGSCVAWCTGYSARSIIKMRETNTAVDFDFNVVSPEYIYNQIKAGGCADGSYVTDALNLLKNQGVSSWNSMPYSSTNGCSIFPNTAQTTEAFYNRTSSYYALDEDINTIKSHLVQDIPVIMAGPVDLTYMDAGPTTVISTFNAAQVQGLHCYAIVGYDDAINAFRIMNSWGPNWGDNGFSWISYDILSTLSDELYVQKSVWSNWSDYDGSLASALPLTI